MAATIRDVAAQARVSIKTVSRVINNEKSVKPRTRAKVMRAIEKLDYHPSVAARGLGGSRSWLIALLYDRSRGYYATSVLAGVVEACRAEHYQVVMNPCDYQSSTLADDVAGDLKRSRADGVIVTPPLSDVAPLIASLDRSAIPYVRVAPAGQSDVRRVVCTNDRQSCARMTEELAALGHARIGFIIGNPDHAAIGDRYSGYLDGLRNCDIAVDKKLIAQGYNSFQSGVQCARQLLLQPASRRPTAIFASNDEMAAGVLAVAHGLGIAVPEELSVAGFDDAPLAGQVWPALTTIKQPIPAMAATAADLLLKELRGEPDSGATHVLESAITFRQSTAPAPNRKAVARVRSQRRAAASV